MLQLLISEICRRVLFGDGVKVDEGETPKKTIGEELIQDSVPGIVVPADRHQRAAVLDLLFPKVINYRSFLGSRDNVIII